MSGLGFRGYRDAATMLCNRRVTATVGVIGVGRMGLPVCARLAASGVRVVASDRGPEREPDVHAAGAGWDGDTARLASRADVLITVLPGSSELRRRDGGRVPGAPAEGAPGST